MSISIKKLIFNTKVNKNNINQNPIVKMVKNTKNPEN